MELLRAEVHAVDEVHRVYKGKNMLQYGLSRLTCFSDRQTSRGALYRDMSSVKFTDKIKDVSYMCRPFVFSGQVPSQVMSTFLCLCFGYFQGFNCLKNMLQFLFLYVI